MAMKFLKFDAKNRREVFFGTAWRHPQKSQSLDYFTRCLPAANRSKGRDGIGDWKVGAVNL